MEEVKLYHHFHLDESIQQINHDVVRMSLVTKDYYEQIQTQLKETTDINIDDIIRMITNNDYCYFIPPSSFTTHYQSEHVWLNLDHVYNAVKFDKQDEGSLHAYLLSMFKIKPTSGYFELVNSQGNVKLFSYLPYHYRNKSDVIMDIYGLCSDEVMKTYYKNY